MNIWGKISLVSVGFLAISAISFADEVQSALEELDNVGISQLESELDSGTLFAGLTGQSGQSGAACDGSTPVNGVCGGTCEDPDQVCGVSPIHSSPTQLTCFCYRRDQLECGASYRGMCQFGKCPAGKVCQGDAQTCGCVDAPKPPTGGGTGGGSGGGTGGGSQPGGNPGSGQTGGKPRGGQNSGDDVINQAGKIVRGGGVLLRAWRLVQQVL